MYFEHGYEGFIEFEIDPKLRDELVIRAAETLDRKKGNEFYFEDNKLRMLYPADRFKDEIESDKNKLKKMWRNTQNQTSAVLNRPSRERVFDFLSWLKENGNIVNAEITPYDHSTGKKLEKIISINNAFYRSITIEEEKEAVHP